MKPVKAAYSLSITAFAFMAGLAFGRGLGDWDRNLGIACLTFWLITILIHIFSKEEL